MYLRCYSEQKDKSGRRQALVLTLVTLDEYSTLVIRLRLPHIIIGMFARNNLAYLQ